MIMSTPHRLTFRCQHDDFRRLLYDLAVSYGASVRFGACVSSIDPDSHSVTLTTGEVIRGDVVIGADGAFGQSRRLLAEPDEVDHPGRLIMYK